MDHRGVLISKDRKKRSNEETPSQCDENNTLSRKKDDVRETCPYEAMIRVTKG